MATAKKQVTAPAAKKAAHIEQADKAIKKAAAKTPAAKATPVKITQEPSGKVKVAAKGRVVEATPQHAEPPAAAKKDEGPNLPAVYRDGTHSAIVFEIGAKAVTLITMATLKVEEMRRVEFDTTFTPYTEYPVRRCAEIYLGSTQYRQIDPETRKLLEAIVADKATEYKQFATTNQESEMPSKVTSKVPSHPLRRASDAPLREALKAQGIAPSAAKGGDKPTPAKKAAETKEAKAAPAKKAAAPAKTTEKPAAKKAPWDKGAAGKTAAAPAAKKAGGTPPTRAPKFDENTKVKMGDTAKAKRGKMLTFIEAAIELAKKGKGQTTRGAIEAKVRDSWEGDDLNTYFPYAVKNGLLVVAA